MGEIVYFNDFVASDEITRPNDTTAYGGFECITSATPTTFKFKVSDFDGQTVLIHRAVLTSDYESNYEFNLILNASDITPSADNAELDLNYNNFDQAQFIPLESICKTASSFIAQSQAGDFAQIKCNSNDRYIYGVLQTPNGGFTPKANQKFRITLYGNRVSR